MRARACSSSSTRRTVPWPGSMAPGVGVGCALAGVSLRVLAHGQGEEEPAATPGFALHPDCSAMEHDQLAVRANPSPVPACFLAYGDSSWVNSLNRRSMSLAAMPMPVSATAIVSACPPSGIGGVVETLTFPPSGVNLMALVIRLKRICLSFRSSASIVRPDVAPVRQKARCRA